MFLAVAFLTIHRDVIFFERWRSSEIPRSFLWGKKEGGNIIHLIKPPDCGKVLLFFFSRDKDGCTPNSVPMVFIVFSRDFCGL